MLSNSIFNTKCVLLINLLFRSHAKTRRIVENAFALWKNKWRCLKQEIRVNTPDYAGLIIKATAYLHNFILKNRLPEDDDDEQFEEMEHQEYEDESNTESEDDEGDPDL